MAQDKNNLLALIATNKPDNSSGSITPAKDREVDEQIVSSNANLEELTEQTFKGPVKFLDSGLGYYEEEGRFKSEVSQSSGGLDVVNYTTFGPAGNTANNIFSIDVNGVLTANKSGPIFFRENIKASRTNTSNEVELFLQVYVSADGGITYSPIGDTRNQRLDSNKSISVFFEMSPIFVNAGLKFKFAWAESSAGGDPSSPTVGVSGLELLYSEPSAALQALGFAGSPSAEITIFTLNGYNYV